MHDQGRWTKLGWPATALWLGLCGLLPAAPLQLVVATAPDTESYRGHLRLFQRPSASAPWEPASGFIPVLYGKKGLAWGIGLHPPQPGLQKRERDGRAPMGRFRIGLIIGNDPQLPAGSKWRWFHHKSERDAWVDDPELPEFYNRLYTLKPGEPVPEWFGKNRMRLDDPAYQWLVVIEHNYVRPVAGAGSAIFFHVRRGEDRPSAGCTVMAREDLEKMIRWLDPKAAPEFVLLDAAHYRDFSQSWHLPAAALALPTVP